MKKLTFLLSLIILAGMLLTACGGAAAPQGGSADTNTDSTAQSYSLIIGPELVQCASAEGMCLQVKIDQQGEWQTVDEKIAGFEFQPGYEYTLLVEELPDATPPAEGPLVRYKLVEILSKTEVQAMGTLGLGDAFWVMTVFGDISAPRTALASAQISLEYDPAASRIFGRSGCNNFFGQVTVEEENLTFATAPMGMTRMACAEEVMQQESAFLEMLGRATHYKIEDGVLTIFTADDEVMQFVPGEAER